MLGALSFACRGSLPLEALSESRRLRVDRLTVFAVLSDQRLGEVLESINGVFVPARRLCPLFTEEPGRCVRACDRSEVARTKGDQLGGLCLVVVLLEHDVVGVEPRSLSTRMRQWVHEISE